MLCQDRARASTFVTPGGRRAVAAEGGGGASGACNATSASPARCAVCSEAPKNFCAAVERQRQSVLAYRPADALVWRRRWDSFRRRTVFLRRTRGCGKTVVEAEQSLSGNAVIEGVPPNGLTRAHRYRALQRAFSLTAAIIALLVCAPLMALIAVLIKLDSRGPVFFVQERIGLHGRRFRLIKFRSMLTQAG